MTTQPTDEKPKAKCPLRYCSFCGKDETEIFKLIAGPTCFVCDECVSLCAALIQQCDNTFFHKIRREFNGAKSMNKPIETIDAPDEFWELMAQEEIYRHLGGAIVNKDADMSANLSERAYAFMEKSRAASTVAWKMIHEARPELDGKQMTASPAMRKVMVFA